VKIGRRGFLAGAGAMAAGRALADGIGGIDFSRDQFASIRVLGSRAIWSPTPTVSTFCDSWSQQQYADGNQLIKSAQSPLTWWAGLTGQTPQWVNNTGISGQRSDQWFARLAAVLADASRWVYVTTPINDGGQAFAGYTAVGGPFSGVAVTMSNVAQVVIANYQSFIQQIIAAGKTPIVVSCVGASNWAASQITFRNTFNAWLVPYLAARNCVLLDAFNIVTDGNPNAVNWLAGMAVDTAVEPIKIHPSNIGAYFLGKNLAQNPAFSVMQTRNVLPTSASPTQSLGTNQLLNPIFATTTGGGGAGFTGDSPASFNWGVTGTVSGVATHSAAAVGNNIIRTETYGGTTTAESRGLQTISSGLPTTGQVIQSAGQIDVAANPTALSGVLLYMNIAGPNLTAQDGYCLIPGAGPAPSEAYTYTALTPSFTVAATPVTALSWSFRGEYAGASGGAAVITQRQAALYLR
jgi:hypothetical protein